MNNTNNSNTIENHERVRKILRECGVFHSGSCLLEQLPIVYPRLMPAQEGLSSCIALLLPYASEKKANCYPDGLNLSFAARAQDYHALFASVYEKAKPLLCAAFPEHAFYCFCDSSPINEKMAAARAGLGVIGRNSLLISKAFGSFIFIGTILTTLPLHRGKDEIEPCIDCKKCALACPGGAISKGDITEKLGITRESCLSYLSHRKNRTEQENALLRRTKTVWGCDICQNICPMNPTPKKEDNAVAAAHFSHRFLDNLTVEKLKEMSDEEYTSHTFHWRGKEFLLNNLINAL